MPAPARKCVAIVVIALLVAGCGSQANGFCAKHRCIPNFSNGSGYVVQCQDGMWSHSGGRSGACSGHGGEQVDEYAPAGSSSSDGTGRVECMDGTYAQEVNYVAPGCAGHGGVL
jgi:hypothetical protein